MSKEAEEIRLCRLFLKDKTHHPDNPSKPMKEGMGPYRSWVEKCNKHINVLNLSDEMTEVKSRSTSRSPSRSPSRSQARSPVRSISPLKSQRELLPAPRSQVRSKSPVRSQRELLPVPRSQVRIPETYTRSRIINTEEIKKDLPVRDRLRPMKYVPPLLSLVQLTVDDFDFIKNESYDKFIDEVIMITNNNGGNINKRYLDDIASNDIVVEIPKKYTSKQTGNNILKFHNDKGISNGRLLYSLAQYIRSNYPDYVYFTGLQQDHGNIYKLILNYEGW